MQKDRGKEGSYFVVLGYRQAHEGGKGVGVNFNESKKRRLPKTTTRHFYIFSDVFYATSYSGRGSDALLRLRPAEQGAKP
jgi:hypothetical protein